MSGSTLRCFLVVFLFFVGFLAILPRILSTDWGKQQLFRLCNHYILGSVEARRVELQWWGGQKIEGVVLRDPEGQPVLAIETVSLQGSLFSILQGSPSIGQLEIEGAHLLLHQNGVGITNLQKALGVLPASRFSPSAMPPLQIFLKRAFFDFFSHEGLFNASVEGRTDRAGEEGKFFLDFSVPEMTSTNWSSVLSEGWAKLLAKGGGQGFGQQIPVEFFEYIYLSFSQQSSWPVQDLLGKSIDFTFLRSFEEMGPWAASFFSPNWKAEVKFIEKQGVLLLQQPCRIEGVLFPKVLSFATENRLELEAPLDLVLEISEAAVPMIFSHPWAAVAQLSWKEQLSPREGARGLSDLEGSCRLEAPLRTQEVVYLVESTGLWQQKPLSFHLQFAGMGRDKGVLQGSGRGEASGIPSGWFVKSPSFGSDVMEIKFSFETKEGGVGLDVDFRSSYIKMERAQFRLDHSPQDLLFHVKGAIDRVQIRHSTWSDWLIFDETLLDTSIKNLLHLQATLHTRFQGWQKAENAYSLSILPVVIAGHMEGSIFSLLDVNLEVMGEGVQAQFCGQINLDEEQLLAKKGICSLSLPPDVLQNLGGFILKDPSFQFAATSIELQVLPSQINLASNWLSLLRLEGKLRLDEFAITTGTGMRVALSQVEMPWKIEGPQDQILCFLKAKWPGEEHRSNAGLGVTLRVDHWLHGVEIALEEAKFELSTEWRSLTFSMLSDWIGLPDLTPLLGEALDLDLKTSVDFSLIEPGYWDMHLDSALFHAKARLKLEKSLTLYQSNKPTAEIRWTLTPEGYQYLGILRGWRSLSPLAKTVVWDAYLTDLDIPLKKMGEGYTYGKISGRCETTDWVWDETDSIGCRGQIAFDSNSFLNEWKVSAELLSTTDLAQEPLFSLRCRLMAEDLYRLDLAVAEIECACEAKKFPYSFCKKLFLLSPSLFENSEAFLGGTIYGSGHCTLSHARGSVEMHISSPHTSCDLVGNLHENGLSLQEALKISIQPSSELIAWGGRLYGDMFHRIVPTSHPIQLEVAPKQTLFPFAIRDITQLRLGEGRLDLGKVSLQNQDGAFSNFLLPLEKGIVPVWCTPIYFSIQDNTLQLKRWDCQVAGRYTLAGWGQGQLFPFRLYLTLGLHPDILQTVFHVSTQKNYLFQIPIKFRGGEIQVSQKKVLARIGALASQLQSDSRGKLVGALLDAALSDNLSATPPKPTTSPFPWKSDQ